MATKNRSLASGATRLSSKKRYHRTSFPAGRQLVAPRVNTLSKYLTRAAVTYARERFGIGKVEWQVITLLGVFQPISIRELTFHALLDNAQVSRAVAQLSEKGYVSRARSARDGREAELTLTGAGKAIFTDLSEAARARNNALLHGWSAEEAKNFLRMVDTLIERAIMLTESDEPEP